MKFIKIMVFFFAVFIVAVFSLARQTEASARSAEIIVDFSESMNEAIGNKSRIDIARELIAGTIDKLGEDARVGLTFYGHRDKDKCDDAEPAMPVKLMDKQGIKQKLSEYKPTGNASTDIALNKASESLNGNNDYISFVLITDGKNRCESDIFKTVREIRQKYDYRSIFYTILINPDNKESFKYNIASRFSGNALFIVNTANIQNTIESLTSLINSAEPYYPKSISNDDMVMVPAGEFYMGNDDPTVDPLEFPKHTIYTDAFYIDKYEVTQKQYYEVMGQNPSRWLGSDLPVDSVSWTEAKTYCEKVGERLPTEAEWEKAAKGGTSDKWSGTSDLSKLGEYAWIHDTGANMRTHPVGQRKPNSYGVYDMCGNVWEWVSDWYESGYYSKSPGKNPKGPGKGILRILRGGNWDSHQYEVRTTSRYPKEPDVKFCNNGFRCAKSAETTTEKK